MAKTKANLNGFGQVDGEKSSKMPYTNGHIKSYSNGHSNGHTNGYTNGHTNGNGITNGH